MRDGCDPVPFILSHCAPFEHPSPGPIDSLYPGRPDHPPPVVRGGWLGAGAWRHVLGVAPRLVVVHVLGTLLVVWVYRCGGRPRRIGRAGSAADGERGLGFWPVWRRVVTVGAWASIAWPGIAILVWVWWYWILVVQAHTGSQVYIEPPAVVAVMLGSAAGYLFTIGSVTRWVVRSRSDHPPESCLDCGYSLAGIRTGICPECGRHAQPSDVRIFALTRPLMRLSMSKRRRWRCLPWLAKVILVLYLLAFPRTSSITGWCLLDEKAFRQLAMKADPWAYRIMHFAGLGGDGHEDQDVIGSSP